jgi:hypothetical protein
VRRGVALVGSLAATVAALLVSGSAHANGRFPAASQLVEAQDDPDHVFVQVTYGFMSTRDGGTTWGWTCEKAVGYVGDVDPPIAIAEGGVSFAALFDGLARSSPDGCDWQWTPGGPDGRYAVDVSTKKGDLRDVILLTSDGLGSNDFDTRVFRSSDAGATFTQTSGDLPSNFVALTVDIAPTEAARVYITGLYAQGEGVYEGVFGRSDDGGATFELTPMEGSANDSAPYLAAVDPTDADVLYVRLAGGTGTLLRSGDAGATFDTIFEMEGSLLGFALSPDGQKIALGGDTIPLHRGSSTGDFTQVSAVLPKCLTWTDRGLYACGSETSEGFTIGISYDEGATFEELYSRFCTEGPVECPAGTSLGDTCGPEWIQTRPNIGADRCETTTGAGGASSSSTGATSATTTTAAGAGGGGADGDDEGGCCTVAAGSDRRGGSPAVALAVVGLGLAFLRRRGR